MKVILYVNEPADLRNGSVALAWALADKEFHKDGAVSHMDGRVSFVQKRGSGTYVIRVQPKEQP